MVMSEAWRLFVGVALDDAWTSLLSDTAEQLQPALERRVRWVRPELYHVTIVFLGDQPADRAADIGEALTAAAASIEAFTLRLAALRLLGAHERGAIVAGVDDPTGRLQKLRATVDAELREHQVRFDVRPLVPHITLGRPRNNAGRLSFPPTDLSGSPPLHVQEIALVKSGLLPDGPRYRPIHQVRLASR
jgi:2'-5' RNA ligase